MMRIDDTWKEVDPRAELASGTRRGNNAHTLGVDRYSGGPDFKTGSGLRPGD
ncbi:MAG: hypothetical protein AAFU85_00220 [Planctomycetota bacterium]